MDCGDEYEKLVRRMNPPRVVIDNEACENATILRIDRVNKQGTLLEVVQVIADINLMIKKAYISSDGNWSMHVFNLTDRKGNKMVDKKIISYIQTTLESVIPVPSTNVPLNEDTSIELTSTDRPGLLSDICAVLTDQNCNVTSAELWTHNTRVAVIVHVKDGQTNEPIRDENKIIKIKKLLFNVLTCTSDVQSARTDVLIGSTMHRERRLHRMMFDDRDYDCAEKDGCGTHVVVMDCNDRGYTVIVLKSKDRAKLLFDTVCALTDLHYVVHHGMVSTENDEAYQEYYVKDVDGRAINSDAERKRVIQCLEAAIERRTSEGLELEIRTEDRAGLLSDITRIFRENGLTIKRAEITTEGGKVIDTFYLSEPSINRVETKTIESIKEQLGEQSLRVKNNHFGEDDYRREVDGDGMFIFGNFFKCYPFRSFRLIKSYS